MVGEFYAESHEWPVSLPEEPDRDRPLVARHKDGTEVRRYLYEFEAWWLDYSVPFSWATIVRDAISDGHALVSLPVEKES